MSFSKILSAQNHLLTAHLISVETDISRGVLHSFSIVGLATKAVDESRDRVSAAIKNSGFKAPKQTNAKIVVSLAPADIRKEGPAFDLPIALGYLLASQHISFNPSRKLFVGELALDGIIRPVEGVLSYARLALRTGISELYVPHQNALEASAIKGITIYGVTTLRETIDHLEQRKPLPQKIFENPPDEQVIEKGISLDDVIGHDVAKRGLIIAAAGGHNIALYGPPGTGKTMLARALKNILPPLTHDESLEVTEIYSATGCLTSGRLITHPPVRAPHHTSSYRSIVGGGSPPRPGEITLAHHGILFLDEFPEFDRKAIDSLRQPLEDRSITIARTKGAVQFPARFILMVTLNPCPCGNRGVKGKECVCTPKNIADYERKISGPIIDRIDMWIEVAKIDHERLLHKTTGEIDTHLQTKQAIETVLRARSIQLERSEKLHIKTRYNSDIAGSDLVSICNMSQAAKDFLVRAAKAHDLSARGHHRVVRLARTIADIDASISIEQKHVLEALQYRQKNFKAKN